ncbi:MAG: signal transduction histidine kinase/ActR/RegA family two-component response regulator [Flavobacteriaceae bacterium]|jgi:signal transduction histidine kinase/ActR/RegA family two-component response regulator
MSRPYNTYTFIVSFLLLFFVSLPVFGTQDKPIDTLIQIEKYRQDATNAITSQDFDVAVINLNKANKLVAQIKDTISQSKVLLTSIDLHYQIHNYEKASSDSEKVISLLQKRTNQQDLARAYNLYALVLTRTEKFNKASIFFKKADEMFTLLNDDENQSRVLLGLGILELRRGNPKSALNYFDAGIPLFKSFNLSYEEATAQLNKAEALLKLEEKTSSDKLILAKNALEIANNIIESNNYSNLKIDSFKITSIIAFDEKDYDTGERNLILYLSEKDAIQQVYIAAISRGLDLELNLGGLNEINANLQNDLDKSKRSINFSKLTNGLSIALIIILSLLTLSLYKNNNLRAKANELLQDKNNELMLAKEKAEKASLAKAQFLSTITHELRTPLYAVTGLTHLLLEENPKENQKENLNSLKFSGEYLLSLINNILDLNKLEANKVEVEKTTFNLKKRMKDVIIALKKSGDDRKTKIHLEFDESIPNSLSGDPLKLSQILINLIGNSVKFTQNGDVFVRVQNIDRTNDKISLHFEIEDNGVGISKKKQKSIFETFSQGSLQINRNFGGTGLGLSIVKNLLELMNSKIQLESQLGKGSKFWFNINFQISEEIGDESSPKNITYDIDYLALENKNVLVVEDNKINQMITKKILEKNKMNCLVADNGMDAIKMVKENTFDIVLMDIHMPGISGIEATQKIREFDTQLPIIALTAVTIDENLDDFYRAGFNEIIPKPFKPEDFFEKIYRTINTKTETTASS